MKTLGQLLDTKGHSVHAVAPGASVIDAIRAMADSHVGALLVMEQERLEGIISERDYARKIILKERSSATTAVRDIMTTPVITLTPEHSIDDAMRLMTTRRIRHLPIMRENAVIGVISIGDLVKCVIEEQQHTIEDLRSYIQG
jgi:CBS domain-containing protein